MKSYISRKFPDATRTTDMILALRPLCDITLPPHSAGAEPANLLLVRQQFLGDNRLLFDAHLLLVLAGPHPGWILLYLVPHSRHSRFAFAECVVAAVLQHQQTPPTTRWRVSADVESVPRQDVLCDPSIHR